MIRNEGEEGTGRTLKMQYWASSQESKLTEITIDDISVGYQDYDSLGRMVKQGPAIRRRKTSSSLAINIRITARLPMRKSRLTERLTRAYP